LNALNLFEFIVSREDVINQKPASDPYRTAIRKSSRELSQILAVEDSESGIASAIGAGLTVWELSKRPKSNSLELLGDAFELEDWFFQ
jgi:HAD superfamily hydrolase (TIGR01509 family)